MLKDGVRIILKDNVLESYRVLKPFPKKNQSNKNQLLHKGKLVSSKPYKEL
jgi:hypothetical protein